jgi:hypothetical protein
MRPPHETLERPQPRLCRRPLPHLPPHRPFGRALLQHLYMADDMADAVPKLCQRKPLWTVPETPLYLSLQLARHPGRSGTLLLPRRAPLAASFNIAAEQWRRQENTFGSLERIVATSLGFLRSYRSAGHEPPDGSFRHRKHKSPPS